MASLHTNSASISALATLRMIGRGLAYTQSQMSSGLRVSTAQDNASYWSISTTMKSEAKSLASVSDSIAMGQAIIDVAYNGMDKVLAKMNEFKKLIVLAANEGRGKTNSSNVDYFLDPIYDNTNLGKIDKQMRVILHDIQGIVDASSFNGINILKNEKNGSMQPGSSLELVSGINGSTIQTKAIALSDTLITNLDRNGDYYMDDPLAAGQGILDGKVRFVTFDRFENFYSAGNVYTNADFYVLREGLYSYNLNPALQAQPLSHYYDVFLGEVDQKIGKITSGMAMLGALQSAMSSAADVTGSRAETVMKGIGRLVDADMNEEATRLKALETQLQLGIQALQITNTSTSRILDLFR